MGQGLDRQMDRRRPHLRQPIADATHIKLGEGDLLQQTRLIPIIGRIRITIAD